MRARIVTALFAVILAASQLLAYLPPDAELTKLLVGTWDCGDAETCNPYKAGGFTFLPDGTYKRFFVLYSADYEIRVDQEGEWKVKDGFLFTKCTKASDSEGIFVGLTDKDELLSVTTKEFRLKSTVGNKNAFTYAKK